MVALLVEAMRAGGGQRAEHRRQVWALEIRSMSTLSRPQRVEIDAEIGLCGHGRSTGALCNQYRKVGVIEEGSVFISSWDGGSDGVLR